MKVICFTEADRNLKTVLDTVNDSDDVMTITRRDADDAVIMSLKNYNSIMETAYLFLLKSPANADYLAKSIAQYEDNKANSEI